MRKPELSDFGLTEYDLNKLKEQERKKEQLEAKNRERKSKIDEQNRIINEKHESMYSVIMIISVIIGIVSFFVIIGVAEPLRDLSREDVTVIGYNNNYETYKSIQTFFIVLLLFSIIVAIF